MLIWCATVIPSPSQVTAARQLLSRYLQPTRLVNAESLESRSQAQVYLKIETDLPTGSFKLRGALNALLTTAAQRALPGVVAASTGNHGAAVAYAAGKASANCRPRGKSGGAGRDGSNCCQRRSRRIRARAGPLFSR